MSQTDAPKAGVSEEIKAHVEFIEAFDAGYAQGREDERKRECVWTEAWNDRLDEHYATACGKVSGGAPQCEKPHCCFCGGRIAAQDRG